MKKRKITGREQRTDSEMLKLQIEQQRAATEASRLELEHKRFNLEENRFNVENSYRRKIIPVLIAALVSSIITAAAVYQSGADNRALTVAINQERKQEVADSIEREAKYRTEADERNDKQNQFEIAKLIITNREAVFYGKPEQQRVLAEAISGAFKADLAQAILLQLEQSGPPTARGIWRAARVRIQNPQTHVIEQTAVKNESNYDTASQLVRNPNSVIPSFLQVTERSSEIGRLLTPASYSYLSTALTESNFDVLRNANIKTISATGDFSQAQLSNPSKWLTSETGDSITGVKPYESSVLEFSSARVKNILTLVENPPAPLKRMLIVQGKVVDESMVPIPNAYISISPHSLVMSFGWLDYSTGADGSFLLSKEFSDLSFPSSITVTVRCTGYRTVTKEVNSALSIGTIIMSKE